MNLEEGRQHSRNLALHDIDGTQQPEQRGGAKESQLQQNQAYDETELSGSAMQGSTTMLQGRLEAGQLRPTDIRTDNLNRHPAVSQLQETSGTHVQSGSGSAYSDEGQAEPGNHQRTGRCETGV